MLPTITAALVRRLFAILLLIGISACKPAPCENPDGCNNPRPALPINYSLTGGNYGGPISVTLSAPDASALYYSTDGSVPSASNCQAYNGETIIINDNTRLRVFAKAPANSPYKSTLDESSYLIENPQYINGLFVGQWLEYEQKLLSEFYCAHNQCEQPKIIALEDPIDWFINCSGGGTAHYTNTPDQFRSNFVINQCSIDGLVISGNMQLNLIRIGLPDTEVASTGELTFNSEGREVGISEVLRRFYRTSGDESSRTGRFDVHCTGADCSPGFETYIYSGAGSQPWYLNRTTPDSCQ